MPTFGYNCRKRKFHVDLQLGESLHFKPKLAAMLGITTNFIHCGNESKKNHGEDLFNLDETRLYHQVLRKDRRLWFATQILPTEVGNIVYASTSTEIDAENSLIVSDVDHVNRFAPSGIDIAKIGHIMIDNYEIFWVQFAELTAYFGYSQELWTRYTYNCMWFYWKHYCKWPCSW